MPPCEFGEEGGEVNAVGTMTLIFFCYSQTCIKPELLQSPFFQTHCFQLDFGIISSLPRLSFLASRTTRSWHATSSWISWNARDTWRTTSGLSSLIEFEKDFSCRHFVIQNTHTALIILKIDYILKMRSNAK